MTVFNGTFPGTLAGYTEGDATILAQAFHGSAPLTVAGGRLYVPPAQVALMTAETTQVAIMGWVGASPNLGTPGQVKYAVIPPEGGWVDGLFDTPLAVAADSPVYIGYTMNVPGDPGRKTLQWLPPDGNQYLGPDGVVRLSGTGQAWHRSKARYGGTGATVDGGNVLIGVDIILEGAEPTTLATPVVTITGTTAATAAGNDGTMTATWPAVSGAASYEAGIASGTGQTSGFVSTGAATSPHVWTGLAPGGYTLAVRALP